MPIAFICICISTQTILLRYGLEDWKNDKIPQTQPFYQPKNNFNILIKERLQKEIR